MTEAYVKNKPCRSCLRSLRKIALGPGHPALGTLCVVCACLITRDHPLTILPLGPGPDAVERKRMRDGRVYTAIGRLAHWRCVTGQEDPQ